MKNILLWAMLCISMTACQDPERVDEYSVLLGEGRLTVTVNGATWVTTVGLTKEAKKDRYGSNSNPYNSYRIETAIGNANSFPFDNCIFRVLQSGNREANSYTLMFSSQLYSRFGFNNISQDMSTVLMSYGGYYGYGGNVDVYTIENGGFFNITKFDETSFEATFSCSLKHYADNSLNKNMTDGKISIKLQ
ncbi:MAG: hypothetical protein EAZ95_16565 [Bacteroidetes bacterium]|nr:MAG: hypothetical protein EAZ95_16565 [Bacteroidota bacterium]